MKNSPVEHTMIVLGENPKTEFESKINSDQLNDLKVYIMFPIKWLHMNRQKYTTWIVYSSKYSIWFNDGNNVDTCNSKCCHYKGFVCVDL